MSKKFIGSDDLKLFHGTDLIDSYYFWLWFSHWSSSWWSCWG